VSWSKRRGLARQRQCQPLGVVAIRLHPDRRALDGPGPTPLGAAAHGGVELGERKVAPAGKTTPKRRGRRAHHGSHPPDSRRARRARHPEHSVGSWDISMTGAARLFSRLSTRQGNSSQTLTLWSRETTAVMPLQDAAMTPASDRGRRQFVKRKKTVPPRFNERPALHQHQSSIRPRYKSGGRPNENTAFAAPEDSDLELRNRF
jgi:hypothetical protein